MYSLLIVSVSVEDGDRFHIIPWDRMFEADSLTRELEGKEDD